MQGYGKGCGPTKSRSSWSSCEMILKRGVIGNVEFGVRTSSRGSLSDEDEE